MLKITIANENGGSEGAPHTYDLSQSSAGWTINDRLFDGDVVEISGNKFHVIWKDKSYNVEIVESSLAEKTFHMVINGRKYATLAKDQIDLLLEGMGLNNQSSQKINHVKAPMPGLIQSISVSVGDHVQKGDILLVLVAMKMENMIKAAGEGIVKSIKVSAGETVEKNQVILEFQ